MKVKIWNNLTFKIRAWIKNKLISMQNNNCNNLY